MIKLYSTGPIENVGSTPRVSSVVWVKILNNHIRSTALVEVKAFSLDGTKTLIFSETIQINPHSSDFRIIDVSTSDQYEVQIRVIRNPLYVLLGVFGKDSNGDLVAAQRLVHSELTVIEGPSKCCPSFFQDYQ